MAKALITFIRSSVIVITRAILRSIKEEVQESQLRAKRLSALNQDLTNSRRGKLEISVEEARQILDLKQQELSKEEINNRFQHLYKVNTHSFYIRSKVFRAYERLIKELYKNHMKYEKTKAENAEQKINKNTEIKCN